MKPQFLPPRQAHKVETREGKAEYENIERNVEAGVDVPFAEHWEALSRNVMVPKGMDRDAIEDV